MKRFFLFALVATLFAACSTDPTQDLAPEIPTAPDELQVSFDEEDTRIQLGENGAPVWTEGDLVSVFYRSNANDKWQFQGNTGDTEGSLKRIEQGTATQPTTQIVAVYPYSENYWFNWNTFNVQASLPAEQAYCKDSYGIGSSVMVSSSEYNQLSFKNVCGWLKLQFTGMGYVSKITFKGNNGEQVAGEIYINTEDASCTLASQMGVSGDGTGGNLVFDDTILTSVTLNCGNGVELGTEPTAFYIALPPQTFEHGITVEIATCDGFTLTRTTENAITIERNHILPMASIALKMRVPNNEIWYTSSDGNVIEPNQTGVFGAKITSNVWDSETYKGIITFGSEVTTIGEWAFYNCDALTSVTIPDSVTTIGNFAFYECDALISVTIPDSVMTIGDDAFGKCSKLTSVTIGDSVTTIGNCAFDGCSKLTSVTIPDSVTTIGYSAFEGCTSLTSVTIPDSVTSIGNCAFGKCSKLTSVTIPDSVTTIGEDTFSYCTSLTSVTIGNSVTTIGNYVFSSCSSLTSVTIPDSVTTIGERAFYGCDSLTAFYGKFASADNRCLIVDGVLNSFAPAGLTEYTIPDSVTTIGEYAFHNCSALTSITIPDSVTTIAYYAFYNCTSLTSVNIPDSVTTIGYAAFEYCTSLKSVTIPDSVTTIGDYAFYDCFSLKEVYCKPTTPPSLDGSSVFDSNASNRKIYVPTASVDAYKSKPYWRGYASAIYPYTFTK